MGKFIDLTGQTFGNWYVESRATNRGIRTYWNCKCSCEKQTKREVKGADLYHQKSTSCGCEKDKKTSERFKKHGKYKTNLYDTWCNIKQRCYNSNNPDYDDYYGGGGVYLQEEFIDDFQAFSNYVLSLQNADKHDELTIDRIDGTGSYIIGNMRWADKTIQARNQCTRKDNKSGIRGVCWEIKSNKWRVDIRDKGKRIFIGYFNTLEESAEARKQAELKYW